MSTVDGEQRQDRPGPNHQRQLLQRRRDGYRAPRRESRSARPRSQRALALLVGDRVPEVDPATAGQIELTAGLPGRPDRCRQQVRPEHELVVLRDRRGIVGVGRAPGGASAASRSAGTRPRRRPGRGRAGCAASRSGARSAGSSGSLICGRASGGSATPLASVRIIPDTAPSSIQRISSSRGQLVERRARRSRRCPSPSARCRRCPSSAPCLTADSSPSKPQSVVGSPPQTICAQGWTPVQPERMKRGHAAAACSRAKSPAGAVVEHRIEVVHLRRRSSRSPSCESSGVYSPKSSIQPS